MNSRILKLAAHVLVLLAMSASAAIRYVDVNNADSTPPYTNWATAAATIQDAVDAAGAGDQIETTQQLADELNRFLKGEPIHARPTARSEQSQPILRLS